MLKVYFAHPCFTDRQKEFKDRFLTKLLPLLSGTDITIVDPFEYTPDIEGDMEAKVKMAEHIKIECIRLLEECHIILALIDNSDTGVAFEAGYAHAVNKPLILISNKSCLTANAMLLGAAKMAFDNILEKGQMEKLVEALKWFEAMIGKYPLYG